MKKIYFLSLMFSLMAALSEAQPCGTQLVGNNFCSNAPFINACLLGGGNCIGSNNSNLTASTPGNLAAAFCGSIENNQFYQFIASSTSVTFNFQASGCANGDGIQGAVFSTPDCTTFTSIVCDGAGSQNFSITATPLVVGQTYYLMIDGFAGDVCTNIQLTSSNGISSNINSTVTTTPATCGSNDGTASITGTGGIPPYTVAIDGSTTFVSAGNVTGLSSGPHTYIIHDAFGCSGTGSFTIGVNKTVASADQNYCTGGGPVTISATGGTQFHWSPTTGIVGSNADSSIIQVAPLVTTMYIVTSNLPTPCKNMDTVVITNVSTFSAQIVATQDTICLHANTTLSVNPTPSSEGPFTIHWTPAGVLSDSVGTSVIANPIRDTTICVSITSTSGCLVNNCKRIYVRGNAPSLSITSSRDNLCIDDTVTLIPHPLFTDLVSCGVIPLASACLTPGPQPTSKIGTTTTGSTTSTPFIGFWEGGHTQYLFRASELQALGLYSGTFTSLGFYVTTKSSPATFNYNNFTIKMTCTSQTSLTAFVPGLPTVFQPQPIITNLGLNTFDLTDPYNWDGTSNLIVEICFDNTNATPSFTNTDAVETSTSFAGAALIDFGDNVPGCNQTTPIVTTDRPNMYVAMCNPATNLTYTWSGVSPTPGSTLSCTNCQTPTATIHQDQTYHLVIADGNCSNSGDVTVHVNPGVIIRVSDTSLCGGSGVDTARLVAVQPNPVPQTCVADYTVASTAYGAIAPSGGTTSITVTGSNDDGYANNIPIPFPFNFYCTTYNSLSFSTNGFISFSPLANSFFTNAAIPTATTPNNIVAVVWDDLITASRDYFTSGTAPNRVFVVRWNNATFFTGGGGTFNAEVHLFEGSNLVETHISATNNTGTKTVGVENSTGTVGTPAPGRNNTTAPFGSSEAWRFTPQTQGITITSYLWTPPAGILGRRDTSFILVDTNQTADYIVTVTFSNGCVSRDTGRVTIGNFPFVGVTATPDSICAGDSSQLQFNGTGGISYVWSPASGLSDSTTVNPFAHPSSTTTYSVTATNNQGCTVSGQASVTVRTHGAITLGGAQRLCYSDSVSLSPSGGPYSSYMWYDTALGSTMVSMNGTFFGHPSHSYYVMVNDGYCDYRSDTARLSSYTVPRVLVAPDTSICPGDSVVLHASAGYVTYQWNASPSTVATATVKNVGDYYVTVTDNNNCRYFSDTASVGFYTLSKPVVTPHSAGICPGDSVTLNATSGLTNYSWNTASTGTSITVKAAGPYYYSARDNHTCLVYSDTATVTANPLPVITFNVPKNPICSTDTITIDAGQVANTVYTWQPGNQTGATYVVMDSGTYFVEAVLNGCKADSSVHIGLLQSPVVTLPSQTDSCICNGGVGLQVTTVQGAVTSYAWSVNAGTVGSVSQITVNTSGTYTVTVHDSQNCSAVASGAVNLHCLTAQITLPVAGDTSIFIGDSASLASMTSYTDHLRYNWTPVGSVTSPTGPSTATTSDSTALYRLDVLDTVYGCRASDTITIVVIAEGRFAMPTAFTPNGDGRNDRMYPVLNNGERSAAKVTMFRIYNRWGQLVYDSPVAPGWDGTFKGEPQVTETYTYIVTVEIPKAGQPEEKESITRQGTFLLWR